MRTEITRDEHDHYRKYGFVILHDFLDAGELAQWRGVFTDAMEKRGRIRMQWDKEGVKKDSSVFTQRVNLWLDHEPLRDLVVDERLGRIATELAEVSGIRLWHDHALVKEPYGSPTTWHMDNPYWSFTHREALSMWLALDDATIQNGCMYFLPGVQHQGTPDKNGGAGGSDIGELMRLYPQWRDIDPVPAEMKAGSCVFHSGYTPHSAGSNMTPRPRRAFVCTYMPVGSTYNGQPNIIPPDKLPGLQVGDTLEFDDLNPILYQRSPATASA